MLNEILLTIPAEKAKYAKLCRLSQFSGRNRSGSNLSGSGKNSGSR